MKMHNILLCFFFLPIVALAQSGYEKNLWYSPTSNPIAMQSIQLAASDLEILGEIEPAELGMQAKGMQYGVQGGGVGAAIAMLIAHGLVATAQQSEQVRKRIEEAREFGSSLTSELKSRNKADLVNYTLGKMPESAKAKPVLISMGKEEKLGAQWRLDLNYEITRNYRSLILNAVFARKIAADPEVFKIQVSDVKDLPYVDEARKMYANYDIFEDASLLLGEAFRIFNNRELLKKNMGSSQQTFRSNIGGKRRFERGMLIAEVCDRHLFENLSEVWNAASKAEKDLSDAMCSTSGTRLLQ